MRRIGEIPLTGLEHFDRSTVFISNRKSSIRPKTPILEKNVDNMYNLIYSQVSPNCLEFFLENPSVYLHFFFLRKSTDFLTANNTAFFHIDFCVGMRTSVFWRPQSHGRMPVHPAFGSENCRPTVGGRIQRNRGHPRSAGYEGRSIHVFPACTPSEVDE